MNGGQIMVLLFITAFLTMIVMQRAYTIERRKDDAAWQAQVDHVMFELEQQHKTAQMYRDRWMRAQGTMQL